MGQPDKFDADFALGRVRACVWNWELDRGRFWYERRFSLLEPDADAKAEAEGEVKAGGTVRG